MFENKDEIEKVILFAVDIGDGENVEQNLDELEELASTAGAITVGRMIQNKESIDNASYLGSGKVNELAEMIFQTGATGVICDDELSPIQMKNLEEALNVKIMDRTMVILDIFASRAITKEGKIQVELAQLKYRSSRLIGMGNIMSRLGGGIGTRGPGEKKLEIDRRIIKNRIAQLSRELKDVVSHRDVMRKQRMISNLPIVAIVGYTNAGKSTLLNILGAIDSATGGKVIANGKNIAGLSEEQLSTYRSKTVGFVFQAFHVISPFFPMAKGLTAYIIRSASEWQFCCIAVAAASSVDPERRNREQK